MNVCYYSDCVIAFYEHQESVAEQFIGTNGGKGRKRLTVPAKEQRTLIELYEELTGQKWSSTQVSERAMESLHIIVQYLIRMAFEQNAKEDIETIRAICSSSKETLDYCATLLPHDEVKFIKFLRTPNTSEEIVERIIFFEPEELHQWTILKKNALSLSIGDASNGQIESSTYEIQLKGEYWTMLHAAIGMNNEKLLVQLLKHYRFAEEDFDILVDDDEEAYERFMGNKYRGFQEFDLFPGEILGFSYAQGRARPLQILSDHDFRFAYYFLLYTDLRNYHTPLLFTRHPLFFDALLKIYFNEEGIRQLLRLIDHVAISEMLHHLLSWIKIMVKAERLFIRQLHLSYYQNEEDVIEEPFWNDVEWQQSTFENAESLLLFTMYVFGDFYISMYENNIIPNITIGDTIETVANTLIELQVIYSVFNKKVCYEKQMHHIRLHLDFDTRKVDRITLESLFRKRTYLTIQLAIIKGSWLKSLGMFRLIFQKYRTLFSGWLRRPSSFENLNSMYFSRLEQIEKMLSNAKKTIYEIDFYQFQQ